MSDDNKPFMCMERGCGMRFTNEDHLCVHIRKHDMSLALNLTTPTSGLSPGMGLFTDQTPTPTKFLKNCEEVGLFQELSKNPFDDSFKKAMDDPLEPTNLSVPVHDTTTLDTPQPSIPKIVIGDNEILEQVKGSRATGGANRSKFQESIDALDKIKTDVHAQLKHTDPNKDSTLSSIVPKKRKKFLSSQSVPTSTTSEDEEESIIGSSSMDTTDVSIATPYVPIATPYVSIATTVINKGHNSPPTVTSSTLEQQQQAVLVTTTQESPSVALTPSTATQFSTVSPAMMTVYLQLPGGQTIPCQVPAPVASPQPIITTAQQVANQPHILQLNSAIQSLTQNLSQQNIPQVVFPNNVQQVYQTIPAANSQTVPTVIAQPQYQTVHQVTPSNIPLNVRTISLGSGTSLQQQAQTGIRTFITNTQNTEVQSSGLQTVLASQQNNVVNRSGQNVFNISPKVTTPVQAENTHSGSQLYTKQRLKAALQQQTTPSSNQKISQIFQMVGDIKREPQGSPVTIDNSSVVSSSESVSSPEERVPQHGNGCQMNPDYHGNGDDRREKFLERNRAAAARCRQKRKHWVGNLESKADELNKINNKLSSEIKNLRGEVAQLKTLLLAHKDCPITRQQQEQGQITPQMYTATMAEDVDSDSQIQTVTILPAGSQALQNTITSNQSTNNTQTASSLLPSIIAINQSTAQTVSQISTNQTMTSLPVSVDQLPNIINIDSNQSENQIVPFSVLTGPNSMHMIPKIINLEQLIKASESQKS